MNSILMSKRPKDTTKEQWQARWDAAGDILQPLADTLRSYAEPLGVVSTTDFDCPNHYAKLVASLVRKQVLEEILAMLPASTKNP